MRARTLRIRRGENRSMKLLNHAATVAFAAILILTPILSALYQWWSGYPAIFYSNALDEGSYLQYDQSQFVSTHMVRPSQYIVTAMHELGISGGLINVVFDIFSPVVLWALTAYCVTFVGYSHRKAAVVSLAIILSPVLFVRINPIMDYLFTIVAEGTLISWVTTPAAFFAPIVRTPEPQSTYILIAAALALSLRFRTFIPAFVVFPILYSFVALPYAFGLTSIFFATRPFSRNLHPAILAGGTAAFLSAALAIYFNYFMGDYAKHLALESRLPLFSITGTVTLLLYFAARSELSADARRIWMLLALTPWFAANHQIFSGFLAQPSNCESYVGAPIAGAMAVLLCAKHTFKLQFLMSGLAAMYVLSGIWWTRDNIASFGNLGTSDPLMQSLRINSEAVAVPDPLLATRLNLVYAKQKPTALSVNRVYIGVTSESLDRYVCSKQSIAAQSAATEFSGILVFLDSAYRDDFEDPLLNLRRTKFPRANHDVFTLRGDCSRFPAVRIFSK